MARQMSKRARRLRPYKRVAKAARSAPSERCAAHLNKLIYADAAAVRLYGPPEGRPYPCPEGGDHYHMSSKY